MKKRLLTLLLTGTVLVYAGYLVGHYLGASDTATFVSSPSTVVSDESQVGPTLPGPRLERPTLVKPAREQKQGAVRPFETSEFREVSRRAWSRLPRMAEIRKKGLRDSHYAPPELLEVADDLGRINELLDADPRLIGAGITFLKRCALEEGVMEAARAVCLRNLKYWSANQAIDMSLFPDHIKRIAQTLPETP